MLKEYSAQIPSRTLHIPAKILGDYKKYDSSDSPSGRKKQYFLSGKWQNNPLPQPLVQKLPKNDPKIAEKWPKIFFCGPSGRKKTQNSLVEFRTPPPPLVENGLVEWRTPPTPPISGP